jgi:diaminopimelate epimerase
LRVEFFKYQSLGNDYILFEALDQPLTLSPEDIRQLCDRHVGVGADGIIIIERGKLSPHRMTNFNPDGSEAEVSGNGLRCVAKHLYEQGLNGEREMEVETLSGRRKLALQLYRDRVVAVEVNMGRPDFRRSAVPMLGEGEEAVEVNLDVGDRSLRVTCLSLGTPHCVLFVEEAEPSLVKELGPRVENHPAFPLRVNVEFASVKSASEMMLRSWERGVGETMASAAGACAAVAAAVRTGRCMESVHVRLPGGLMEVKVNPEGEMLTKGPARRVFRGFLDEDWRERSRIVLS